MSSSRRSGPAFVATLHDPDGRYLAVFHERASALGWYSGVSVRATDTTDPRLVAALRDHGATVIEHAAGSAGAGRRAALLAALEAGHETFVHCDFDRWLHWAGAYPDELAGLPGVLAAMRPRRWFVCLGRTGRAFASHPEVQRVTETATNRALEIALGRPIDAVAGACWLTAEAAVIIVRESREATAATDLEWPALIQRAAPARLGYLATEGLEFETAEFYREEIAGAGGIDAWLEVVYQRPEVWTARLQLAADSARALSRVLAEPAPIVAPAISPT